MAHGCVTKTERLPVPTSTYITDTIVALATAPLPAGVAVVRVSGPLALPIAQSLSGKAQFLPGFMQYCTLRDRRGQAVDRGYVVFFAGPKSFTGHDIAEFHVHGSRAVTDRVCVEACHLGARPAEPGEFTQQAFEQGKLDLPQVEALADLIAARSEVGRATALAQLDGQLSEVLMNLRTPVLRVLAELEARLDFGAEQDVGALDLPAMQDQLRALAATMQALAATAHAGQARLQGARVALYGAPNAGKSTLFNALLGHDRALVDAQPGTTRDTIEAQTAPQGLLITWIDTAGVRATDDRVEAAGRQRALREIAQADLVLWLEDGAQPPAELPPPEGQGSVLRVLTKADQPPWHPEQNPQWLRVSAASGLGLTALLDRVVATLHDQMAGIRPGGATDLKAAEVVVTRQRHADALLRAADDLQRAADALGHAGLEYAAADAHQAADTLDELLGTTTADDVLGVIFSQFCIGK